MAHFLDFDIYLCNWPLVKVIITLIIKCALLGCTLVPSINSVCEISSEIWPIILFLPIFEKNLTLTFDLDLHWHLGHRMCLHGLYLDTKYEVCRCNRIWEMANCLIFYSLLRNLTLTFDLDHMSQPSALGQLNASYWVVPWYQVWSL